MSNKLVNDLNKLIKHPSSSGRIAKTKAVIPRAGSVASAKRPATGEAAPIETTDSNPFILTESLFYGNAGCIQLSIINGSIVDSRTESNHNSTSVNGSEVSVYDGSIYFVVVDNDDYVICENGVEVKRFAGLLVDHYVPGIVKTSNGYYVLVGSTNGGTTYLQKLSTGWVETGTINLGAGLAESIATNDHYIVAVIQGTEFIATYIDINTESIVGSVNFGNDDCQSVAGWGDKFVYLMRLTLPSRYEVRFYDRFRNMTQYIEFENNGYYGSSVALNDEYCLVLWDLGEFVVFKKGIDGFTESETVSFFLSKYDANGICFNKQI